MASGDEDGGPAFPLNGDVVYNQGMSLRDWFAGQALAGLLCAGRNGEVVAEEAYDYADAMLEARK